MKTEPIQNNLTQKVAQKAKDFIADFKCETRPSTEEKFYTLKANANPDLCRLVREAHGDFLPDDFRYEMIVDALYAFGDCEDDADLEEVQLEPDVYNHDLLKWLSSNLNRIAYCDETREEFGLIDADLMTLITYGQQREKDEVISLVRDFLINLCESQEEES